MRLLEAEPHDDKVGLVLYGAHLEYLVRRLGLFIWSGPREADLGEDDSDEAVRQGRRWAPRDNDRRHSISLPSRIDAHDKGYSFRPARDVADQVVIVLLFKATALLRHRTY